MAAARAYDRIDRDLARASAALQPALVRLRAHLFDSDLSVESLARDAGIRLDSLFVRFATEIDTSPAKYIARLRYDTAATLAAASELPLQAIAGLVGIPEGPTFRRAFKRRFGVSASQYRARAGERGEAGVDLLEASTDGTTRRWLRIVDAWTRIDEALGPPRGKTRREALDDPASRDFDRAASARRRAEQAWAIARTLDETMRRAVVRHTGRTTAALAELLFEKSRTEGRGDRTWGIRVAEAALAAIPDEACEAWTADAIHHARIRAWAWLGNARCLALDFPGAAEAFDRARQLRGSKGVSLPGWIRSEGAFLEAGLYWQWSQPERALALANSSVAYAEDAEDQPMLLLSLRRRAAVNNRFQQFTAALDDLSRIEQILGQSAPRSERAVLAFLIASSHEQSGDAKQARPHLARARALAGEVEDKRYHAHLAWLEGRVALLEGAASEAARLLEEAIRAFEPLDCRFEALMATVDHCLALLEAGKTGPALAAVAALRPALALVQGDPEWRELLQKLAASLARASLGVTLLRALQGKLESLLRASASLS